MKIKYLGTAAAEGWPGLFCQCNVCEEARRLGGKNIRTRSSSMIDDKYMVDFPPDTYQHVLSQQLQLADVEHIFVTHSHQDHFYPLDLHMREKPFAHLNHDQNIYIYGNKSVGDKYEETLDGDNTLPSIIFKEVSPFKVFKAGEAEVIPLLANHDPEEECYIYMIKLNQKRILYGHDTGYFPEETWNFIKDNYFDGVILDCTSGGEECRDYHMGFSTVLEVKERLLTEGMADEKTIFTITHFSHNGKLLHEQLVKLSAPHNFQVAYDGFEQTI